MKIVTTSWDDGFKESFEVADLLAERGLAGTFYVPLKAIEDDSGRLLNVEDIKRLSKRFEIGAHGVTHKPFTEMDNGEWEVEVELPKHILEPLIGVDIRGLAYPWGRFNMAVIESVKRVGYDYARTTVDGRLGFSDRFRMPVTAFCGSNLMGRLKFSLLSPIHGVYAFGGDWEDSILKAYRTMLRNGGVLHIVGHPQDWCKTLKEKLGRVFGEISGNRDVKYLTNWEVVNELEKIRA